MHLIAVIKFDSVSIIIVVDIAIFMNVTEIYFYLLIDWYIREIIIN